LGDTKRKEFWEKSKESLKFNGNFSVEGFERQRKGRVGRKKEKREASIGGSKTPIFFGAAGKTDRRLKGLNERGGIS